MGTYPRVTYNPDGGMDPRDSILGGHLQITAFEDKCIVWQLVTWGGREYTGRYVRIFGYRCSQTRDEPGGLKSFEVFPIDRESSRRDAEDVVDEQLRKHDARRHDSMNISIGFWPRNAKPETFHVIGTHPSKLVPIPPTYQAPYASPDGTTIHYPPGTYPGNGYIS